MNNCYYILHTFLSVAILISEIVNIFYYVLKHWSKHRLKHRLKQKIYYHINNIKMGSNNKLKEVDIKNCTCYYFGYKINF